MKINFSLLLLVSMFSVLLFGCSSKDSELSKIDNELKELKEKYNVEVESLEKKSNESDTVEKDSKDEIKVDKDKKDTASEKSVEEGTEEEGTVEEGTKEEGTEENLSVKVESVKSELKSSVEEKNESGVLKSVDKEEVSDRFNKLFINIVDINNDIGYLLSEDGKYIYISLGKETNGTSSLKVEEKIVKNDTLILYLSSISNSERKNKKVYGIYDLEGSYTNYDIYVEVDGKELNKIN